MWCNVPIAPAHMEEDLARLLNYVVTLGFTSRADNVNVKLDMNVWKDPRQLELQVFPVDFVIVYVTV